MVRILTRGQPRGFAQRIADIAQHEQVCKRNACEARGILGFASEDATGKASERSHRRSGTRIRAFDPFSKLRINRDVSRAGEIKKAPREVGIVNREGSIDLASGNPRVKQARDRVIRECYRIILAGQEVSGLERARSNGGAGNRPDDRENDRHPDPHCNHGTTLASQCH